MRIGYACISMILREQNIFCSRRLTLKTLQIKGVAEIKRLARQNMIDLLTILEYNEQHGLRFFRITSELIPHYGNPLNDQKFTISFAKKYLKAAGEFARQHGHRITSHPGQFAQLGSTRREVVKQTYKDLSYHAKIFEYMGYTPQLGSVMIIHGGGRFGDKIQTMIRWRENFQKLPEHVKRFIVLENDDISYTVLDLLPVCEDLNIPLCIDFFHHQCLGKDLFDLDDKMIQRVMNLWFKRGIKPKIHWSNQAPDKRKGAHDNCVTDIPTEILNICKKYDADIMLETKTKDLCALKMYNKYFNRIVMNNRIEWDIKV